MKMGQRIAMVSFRLSGRLGPVKLKATAAAEISVASMVFKGNSLKGGARRSIQRLIKKPLNAITMSHRSVSDIRV